MLVGCGGFAPQDQDERSDFGKGDGVSGTTAALEAMADAAGGDSATVAIDGREGQLSLTYHRGEVIDDRGIDSTEEYLVEFIGFSLDGKTFVEGTLHYSLVSKVDGDGVKETEVLEGELAITGEESASLKADLHRIDVAGSEGIAADENGTLEVEGRPFEYLEGLFEEVSATIESAGDSRDGA